MSAPVCCQQATAAEREALHAVDPVLARIQRTLGAPVLHPTDHGLDWEPHALDCPESVAAAPESGRLVDAVKVDSPAGNPLVSRTLDPSVALGNRAVRVAVLDLQRGETDFAGSVELQFAAGDLARVGHDCELVRAYTGMTGSRLDEQRWGELVALLAQRGFEVVAVRTHVHDGLISALRAASISTIYLDSVSYRGRRPPEGLYDRVQAGDDRKGLIAALDTFVHTQALPPGDPLPGSGIQRIVPKSFIELDHYWPAVRFRDAQTGAVRPLQRHMLIHAYGCPYSADVADNPVYAGVEINEGVKRPGCTYCAIGGDYSALPVKDYVGFLADQIAYFASQAPGTELVVSDEATFSFLGRLIDRLVDRQIQPGPLLIKARLNGLIPILDRFAGALERAREGGLQVVCYLMGIENFSDVELARYNKGVDQAQLVGGLRTLLELEEQFAETFWATKYNAHGFILYNPWTTLDDLHINRHWFDELQIRRWSGKAVWSRLRLHRWQPLWALAERDGLLEEDAERFSVIVQREVGYHDQEEPWRFSDPGVELVYFLTTRGMQRHASGDEQSPEIFGRALTRAAERALSDRLTLSELESDFEAWVAEETVFFAGSRGLRQARQAVERAIGRLASRSRGLKWQLASVTGERDRFRLVFSHPSGGMSARMHPTTRALDWDPPSNRAGQLFARALTLMLLG